MQVPIRPRSGQAFDSAEVRFAQDDKFRDGERTKSKCRSPGAQMGHPTFEGCSAPFISAITRSASREAQDDKVDLWWEIQSYNVGKLFNFNLFPLVTNPALPLREYALQLTCDFLQLE